MSWRRVLHCYAGEPRTLHPHQNARRRRGGSYRRFRSLAPRVLPVSRTAGCLDGRKRLRTPVRRHPNRASRPCDVASCASGLTREHAALSIVSFADVFRYSPIALRGQAAMGELRVCDVSGRAAAGCLTWPTPPGAESSDASSVSARRAEADDRRVTGRAGFLTLVNAGPAPVRYKASQIAGKRAAGRLRPRWVRLVPETTRDSCCSESKRR